MTMKRAGLTLLTVLLLAAPVYADARAEEKAPEEMTKGPDYSSRALLQFVIENRGDDGEDGLYIDDAVGYRRGEWNFKWIPVMAPLLLSQGMGGNVSAMPVVDPLVLTGTSMPYTAATWNGWANWRERRFLRKNIEAANRKQNN